LSQRFDVSRVHINRMFRGAQNAGYLTVDKHRVRFSSAMSQDAEQHYALTFSVMAHVALAAN
jgi:hypothetical protein